MDNDLVLKALHILLGKYHLWQAHEGQLTLAEWNLMTEISDWYESEGKLLVESRRLTQMEIMLDW